MFRQAIETAACLASTTCGAWKTWFGAVDLASDALLLIAYAVLASAVWYVFRHRPEGALRRLAVPLCAFMLVCGVTSVVHLAAPASRIAELETGLKFLSAGLAILAALMILPLIPRALAIPSPRELHKANTGLSQEIRLHQQTLTQLRTARDELEARVEARTRELNQAKLRVEALVQASAQIFWQTAPDGLVIDDLPSWGAFTGQTREQIIGQGWLDAVHPEDRRRTADAWQHAVAKMETYTVEYRMQHADGGWRWTAAKGVPMFDDQGAVREWVGMNTDITERKRTEEHTFLIMRELSHRTKNLLAVVSAMARRTLQDAKTTDQFARDFEARIQGLSRSHDLLVKGNWEGALLDELVKSHLAAFTPLDDGRSSIKGPRALLKPEATQTLGLALHELATNAAKHGALAGRGGRIDVTWQLSGQGEGRTFEMTWRERSPKPIADAPEGSGFGRTVLELLAAKALSGVAEYRFERAGIVWNIRAPAETVVIEDPVTGPPTGRLARASA